MTLSRCKVIDGRAFNIKENENNPLLILNANFHSIASLVDLANFAWPGRVCFIGSSCMYPVRDSALREEMLGTGPVYPSNSLYSYIKLLGWQICKTACEKGNQFFMVIPSDIFGDAEDTHFITQIMKKLHGAKVNGEPSITLWGTGSAIRHPLFKNDFKKILENICSFYEGTEPINIAPPVSFAKSISSIVTDIAQVVDYTGKVEFDCNSPDGQAVKILDNTRLTELGFSEFTPWLTALEKTYSEIKNHV